MKVLIVYASAGAGHFKAAKAIYDYFKEYCPQVDSKIIDVLEKTNSLFRFSYIWGYPFLVRYALFLWRWAFWLTYAKSLRRFSRPAVSFLNQINTKNFAALLAKENPDFIITTHFLASEISAHLKQIKKISYKIITVITDFGVHPFWINKGTDIYIVASDSTKAQLVLEGIEESNIKEFGIPIESKFLKQYDRVSLSKKFDIDEKKFTVLIMTGSFGLGPLEGIVKMLYRDVQILVVCAANKRLYARLKNRNIPNVKVFEFVDNAQELMVVSDIIITKPGGLSISEVLAMELAPIFISAIPGQEEENLKVLIKYGVGLSPKRVEDIKDIILDFRDHPDKLKSIKGNIRKIKKPFASREICNAICQGSSGASS